MVLAAKWERPQEDGEDFFSAKEEQIRAFQRRFVMRQSLFEVWNVDIGQTQRICEERQEEVGASHVSYVSWDTIEETSQRQGVPFFSAL